MLEGLLLGIISFKLHQMRNKSVSIACLCFSDKIIVSQTKVKYLLCFVHNHESEEMSKNIQQRTFSDFITTLLTYILVNLRE